MRTRHQAPVDDILFWTLKLLQDNREVARRTLAKEVGINVSSVNSRLKTFVGKGWIELGNCSKTPKMLSHAYLLAAAGSAEKAVLGRRTMRRKIAEYEELHRGIKSLQRLADTSFTA